MKLEDLKIDYSKFPQLPEMKMRWHHDYWDGAMSGVCEINGKLHWFQMVDQFDDFPDEDVDPVAYENFVAPWYRRFLVWSLPDSVMATIVQQHEDGRKAARYLDPVSPATAATSKAYFAEKIQYPNIVPEDESQIVGWWEWK